MSFTSNMTSACNMANMRILATIQFFSTHFILALEALINLLEPWGSCTPYVPPSETRFSKAGREFSTSSTAGINSVERILDFWNPCIIFYMNSNYLKNSD